MKYRMIGIDLDGTLLDRRGRISPANLAAIDRARHQGVLVVPCTGRAWRESRGAIQQLMDGAGMPGAAVGVFVGGAAVSELATGRSLDIAVLEPNLALEAVQLLFDGPEAVLVFRDANLVGHDYLVTGRGTLSANTQWWFEATGATAHFQKEVGAADLHHTLRVGIVAPLSRMRPVAARLRQALAERVVMQHFEAVQMPNPEDTMSVLEVFAAGVDKWRGLSWVAQQHGIVAEEVVVMGDEVNDLAMIRSAGCGIAMANAIEPVKSAARHVTRACEDNGVAYAVEQVLAGVW
jgi:hydroxymethylpyrimidine pyrophosphatase-like HAD family hydrolase